MSITSPTQKELCDQCDAPLLISDDRCPHCGQPGRFPNVRLASHLSERKALEKRYTERLEDTARRGAGNVLADFEAAAAKSYAIIARSLAETRRLASSDRQVYATYENELDAGARLPEGSPWDRWRRDAGEALFGAYHDQVRFGALSLEQKGLAHYGDCFWVMREKRIRARASVFEQNSGVFVRDSTRTGHDEIPPGKRATWDDRGRLCVAKLAPQLSATTEKHEFADLLLRPGKDTGEDDDFIEVHIGGSLTAWTLQKVVLIKNDELSAKGLKGLRENLKRFDVELVEAWTP